MRLISRTANVPAPSAEAFMHHTINMGMTPREWGLLTALSVIRGGSFLFVAVAVTAVPPLAIFAVHVGLAALFFAAAPAERRTTAGAIRSVGHVRRNGRAQQRPALHAHHRGMTASDWRGFTLLRRSA